MAESGSTSNAPDIKASRLKVALLLSKLPRGIIQFATHLVRGQLFPIGDTAIQPATRVAAARSDAPHVAVVPLTSAGATTRLLRGERLLLTARGNWVGQLHTGLEPELSACRVVQPRRDANCAVVGESDQAFFFPANFLSGCGGIGCLPAWRPEWGRQLARSVEPLRNALAPAQAAALPGSTG